MNAAGNPLHPDPAVGERHAALLRGAVELAALVGCDRVVTMSGCPGGRDGGRTPVFASWPVVPDDESLWEWQYEHRLAPFWRELGAWTAQAAPSVEICLELHAGASAYNPASFARIRAASGPNVGVNLDPSHFWWQGMDPVAVIEQVGPAIGFAHGKDTLVHPDRVRRNGAARPGLPGGSRDGLLALLRGRHRPRRRRLDGARRGPPPSRLRRRHLDRARGSPGRPRRRASRRRSGRSGGPASGSRRPRERDDARRRPPLRSVGRHRLERPAQHRARRRRHPPPGARRDRRARLPHERGRPLAQAPRDPDPRRRYARRPEPVSRRDRPPDRAARSPRRLRGRHISHGVRSRHRGRPGAGARPPPGRRGHLPRSDRGVGDPRRAARPRHPGRRRLVRRARPAPGHRRHRRARGDDGRRRPPGRARPPPHRLRAGHDARGGDRPPARGPAVGARRPRPDRGRACSTTRPPCAATTT